MKASKILEGNKLIADFMGHKFETLSNNKKPSKYYMIGGVSYKDELLKYHKSWDWIMPVVDMFSKKRGIKGVYNEYCNVAAALGTINIEMLWEAVIEFIKWSNAQPIDL